MLLKELLLNEKCLILLEVFTYMAYYTLNKNLSMNEDITCSWCYMSVIMRTQKLAVSQWRATSCTTIWEEYKGAWDA